MIFEYVFNHLVKKLVSLVSLILEPEVAPAEQRNARAFFFRPAAWLTDEEEDFETIDRQSIDRT